MKSQDRTTGVRKPDPPARKQAAAPRPRRWRTRLKLTGGALLVLVGALLAEQAQSRLVSSANAASEQKAAPKEEARERVTNAVPLSNAELQILKTLEKRREALDQQDKDLKRREERIKLAEKQIDGKLEELKKLRAEIQRLYEEEQKARDARLQMMTTTICINMKPDQSAAILAKMEPEIVLRMFSLIPEKQLSRILEKMDREKAAQLTAEYVKQKKNLPKPPEK